jgi:hypothetical protein
VLVRRGWLLAALPLALGLWVGYQSAYAFSLPGFAGIAGVFFLFVMAVIAIALGIVGIVATTRGPRRSGLARGAFATAGLLVVSTTAGVVLTPALGLQYHEPVILHASGQATLELPGVDGFVAAQAGAATCGSVGDSTDVGVITALDLGELDAGTLRAQLFLAPRMTSATIQLFIDGDDLPAGSGMVSWDGSATSGDLTGGVAPGSVDFQGVPYTGEGVAKPGGEPSSSSAWPAALSGTLHWSCQAWSEAAEVPPSPAAGSVRLDLRGVDWSGSDGLAAQCQVGTSGAIGEVDVSFEGSLQGSPIEILLDLGQASGVGDKVRIWILLAGKDPPPGLQFKPNWQDRVPLSEAGPGLFSGRIAFSGLPTGVDPASGPAPTGWPTTLTGSLTWECG